MGCFHAMQALSFFFFGISGWSLSTTDAYLFNDKTRNVWSRRQAPPSHTRFAVSRGDSEIENTKNTMFVALTREDGKNDKLREALESSTSTMTIQTVELPCIAHADGSDFPILAETLTSQPWNYVAVTSPEAARVLASAWDVVVAAGAATPPPAVCAVGKATMETLNEHGIEVAFCPSKATAATLVTELPGEAGWSVLYPASSKAKQTLEKGLQDRGFVVKRLNTYDTVTAEWGSPERETASQCQIACFASPSSVKGWLHNMQQHDDGDARSVLAACIGETSATACRELGWSEENIFYPDKPGIEGWVDAVLQAATSLRKELSSSH